MANPEWDNYNPQRIYTEAERDAAVAGAYRAAADLAVKWRELAMFTRGQFRSAYVEGRDNRLSDCADELDAALTPASAQKAFADAVAAEVRDKYVKVENYRAMSESEFDLRRQLTRLTEEKERLRKSLQEVYGNIFHQRIEIPAGAAMPSMIPCKDTCLKCRAGRALTPAAGGETRGK